jgi:hypothetical protein
MNDATQLIQTAIKKAALVDYLTGLRRADPATFNRIAKDPDTWRIQAEQMLSQRRMAILEVLPDDLLTAIAKGDVSVWKTAEEMSK